MTTTNEKLIHQNNAQLNTIMNKSDFKKPFLKWVGGKTQIAPSILSLFPKEINNYHELFLGGGSILLALLSLQKQNKITIKGKIYAYDINPTLIHVYKHVQTNKDELFACISQYIETYASITCTSINRKPQTIEQATTSKESYYYWVRQKFNNMDKASLECAAIFIFLNKTCFRGMYREGPNGFNVPYGHYKTTPTVITKQELDVISDLIKNVEFACMDFNDSIKNVEANDFMYLDPPYAPETRNSFVGYTSDGFSLDTHKKLFESIKEAHLNRKLFIMSNAKVDLVQQYFNGFKAQEISARRAINARNPESVTTEVIVYNFE